MIPGTITALNPPDQGIGRNPTLLPELLESRVLLSSGQLESISTGAVAAVVVGAVSMNANTQAGKGITPPTQSMLTSVAVQFSAPVSLSAAALSLQNLTKNQAVPSESVRLVYQASSRTATWTFPGQVGGSLRDGRYQATLHAAMIKDSSARALDGNADGLPGGDYSFQISRLFGDANGDGLIATGDVIVYGTAGDKRGNPDYQSRFDFNSDGAISSIDRFAADARIGTSLSATPPVVPTDQPKVTRLVLVNTSNARDITTLANGSVIDRRIGQPPISVRADVSGPAKSVKFLLDGKQVRIESGMPYAIGGDHGGTYYAWSPPAGTHTLTAIAYPASGAAGSAGPAFSLTIKVVTGTAALTAASTTQPAAGAAAVVTNPQITTIKIQARRKQTDTWTNYWVRTLPTGLTMEAPVLSKYGGDTSQKLAATGYFRAQKINGKWWFVDPEGNRYFDNAATSVGPRIYPDNAAEYVSKFGQGPTGVANWATWVRGWMRDIGLYSAAPWGTPSIQAATGQKMNYTLLLDLMSGFGFSKGYATSGTGNTSYRNGAIPVFDPAFPVYCQNYLSTVLPEVYPDLSLRSDPHLIGYMTDNELPWQWSSLDAYLGLPAGDPNRVAAQNWLKARGVTTLTATAKDRSEFLVHVAETYFRITSQAIRAYDPNHLILGCRFTVPDARKAYLMNTARKHTDVASVNYYFDMDPARIMEPATATADMPYMVTEFYTKGVDSGMPNTTGAGLTVKTQADRGAYYQQMMLSMLGSSRCVGAAWLDLMDNDLSDPNPEPSNQSSNKGLMTVRYPIKHSDNPYKPLTDRIRDLTHNLYPLANFLRGS